MLHNNQQKIQIARKTCIEYQKQWKKMILEMKIIYKNIITTFFISRELATDMNNFKNKRQCLVICVTYKNNYV
ncbi:hypothetical protein SAP269_00050 [Spiroplasma ixodetis]|uniref:Uncharacterized protein n=1 Tax=Spiroplasma ixodetis TaxID=2141 RepID=A0ABM8JNI1_9MOLU